MKVLNKAAKDILFHKHYRRNVSTNEAYQPRMSPKSASWPPKTCADAPAPYFLSKKSAMLGLALSFSAKGNVYNNEWHQFAARQYCGIQAVEHTMHY